MNVRVMIPETLRSAVDGRRKLELGVPQGATVGDLVQTLLSLYPRLVAHLPSDRRPARHHLNLYVNGTLHEGQTVYLFATGVPPPQLARRPTGG